MYTFTTQHYQQLAERFIESISSREFFSGSILFDADDADIRFVATLIISHRNESLPEGDILVINSIIPVWWEMHTTTLDGEVINDFDFGTFVEHVTLC